MLIVAHGESWEVTASRAVSEMIEKILSEHDKGRKQLQENGTFELHYTPTNTDNKTFVIPLPVPRDHQLKKSPESNGQQYPSETKQNQNQFNMAIDDSIKSFH